MKLKKEKGKINFKADLKNRKGIKWKAKTNLSNGLLKTINYYDNEL